MSTDANSATEATRQEQEVPRSITIDYGVNRHLKQYTCHKCGADGVRLWKDYATSKPEQTCAECTALLFPNETLAGRDETKGRIPAIPIQVLEDGTLVYGYVFEVPDDGWKWWESLPEKKATPSA